MSPRPYRAYAGLVSLFAGAVAGTAVLSRRLERDPREQSTLDLAVLGLATFKAARTLVRDEVTSFVREPFVEGQAHGGDESPVQTGDLRQAVGELVTCSRCVGTWAALGLTAAQVLAPRFGRVVSWTLAAGALNDWLQAGFAALTGNASARGSSSD